MADIELSKEFDRQIQNLVDRNYPKEIGVSSDKFKRLLDPLKNGLSETKNTRSNPENGITPFVIVIKSNLLSSEKAMELTNWNGRKGITKLFPLNPTDFSLIDNLNIPDKDIYLLVQINRGGEYLNVRPNDALIDIGKKGFSPLTIDEGIAVVTHFPGFLKRNNCFSLLASRKANDQRVPAIWINSKNQANLGWCWNGNPHTWLGSAYCKLRI